MRSRTPGYPLPELGDRGPDDVQVRRRERAERDGAGDDRAGLAHGLLRVPGRRHRPLGARHEQPAGVGQHEPAVRPHEERDAEPLLQPPQLLRQARLRHEAGLGRTRHGAPLDRRQEVAQLLERDDHARGQHGVRAAASQPASSRSSTSAKASTPSMPVGCT